MGATDAAWLATPDPCPMGCGELTEDPYGGPCRACWAAVDQAPAPWPGQRAAERRRGMCDHAGALPVSSGGEVLAALCPDCDRQLPAAFLGCRHSDTIDVSTMSEPPGRQLCMHCGAGFWRTTSD